MKRRLVLACVLSALLVLAGCTFDEAEADARTRESPHAVFEALVTALEKQDVETVVACLDPDTVAKLAARGAWSGLEERDDLQGQWRKPDPDDHWPHRSDKREETERQRERRKARSAILDRHGLTKDVSDELRKSANEKAAQAALPGRINDPAGFLVAFLRASEREMGKPVWVREGFPRPRLKGVAFDGDEATGQVFFQIRDKGPVVRETSRSITFRRQSKGDWRVVGISLMSLVGFPQDWGKGENWEMRMGGW